MKLNKSTENALSLIVVQVVNLVLPLLAVPYLAKVLGPENLGNIVFSIAIAQILVVLTDFGFNLSASRDIAIYKDNIDKIFEIWVSVTIVKTLLTLIGLIILILSYFLFERIHQNFLIYILGYTLVIGNLIYPQWLFQGLEKLRFVSFIQVFSRILVFFLLLFFVKSESDIYWAIFFQCAGGLIAGLILIPSLINILKPALKKMPSKDILLSQVKDSWIIFIPNIFGNLYLSCNTFFLGLLLSPTLVANYYIAEKMIRAAISLCSPISTALFPQQVRNFSKSKESALNDSMVIIYFLLSIFSIGSLITYFTSEYFVNLFFGSEYKQAGYLLKIFSPLPILVMLSIIFANLIMIPAGLERTFSKIIMYSSIVNVIFFMLLVYYFSNTGAVLANIFVELIICLSMFIVLNKSKNNPFIYWKKAIYKIVNGVIR
ncbi:oligosaccharide flippase family protein [Acinetobacter sp. ESL0695]|uniref:oligosaccharide flippase family protein n=1 Tax=Acinetobacter sp. ESL0695 TaxID=2983215 RepID=UPI0023F0AED8|nr:oligosaccharide flippase family protein [Acinetobacter sp. ESL0695]WEV48812.1 oligosaccharide flippase family protein [Acinetobacter sp. ESL0695]